MNTIVSYALPESIQVMDMEKGIIYHLWMGPNRRWSLKTESFWAPADFFKEAR